MPALLLQNNTSFLYVLKESWYVSLWLSTLLFWQIAELEAMLGGGGGRSATSTAQKEHMGDQASKACTIQ